jgi:K(+)-stimulated pyrophosphate-energized sodium pump
VLCAISFYFAITMLLPVDIQMGVFISSLIGLLVGILVLFITDYYTGDHKPVHDIAQAATTGAGTNIITGLAVGLESTLPFALVIIGAISISFYFGGIYGIAIATLALLSLTGIIVAVDTFGPVSDNAGGIVEMSELPEEYRKVTDKLDMVGNTTKATTKGFAIASAGLAVLVLILAFTSEANVASAVLGKGAIFPVDAIGLPMISLIQPPVLLGLMVGAVLPFIFSAYAMRAVGIAAMKIVEEVRRQFRTLKIMEGKDKPDYEKCVEISTQAAIGELLKVGALVVLTPLLVGFLFGVHAIAGLLMGSLLTGMLMAVFMSNTGGAWDNAKKYIESGHHGGKKSDAHKAAVVGDTVGDPFKDTAGPALNPMIKILNTMSIILAVLFVAYSLNLLG